MRFKQPGRNLESNIRTRMSPKPRFISEITHPLAVAAKAIAVKRFQRETPWFRNRKLAVTVTGSSFAVSFVSRP
jgi:hypothetical protein